MLYNVLAYDAPSRTAIGVPASIPTEYDYNNREAEFPPHSVCLYSYQPLKAGHTYSFVPKNQFINGDFIRGELDYKNPGSYEDSAAN